MKPTPIINRTLEKPWLLIACYEVSFDNYLSIHNRLQRFYNRISEEPSFLTTQTQATMSNMQGQLKNISENLRGIDEMIHNYIKTHQS